MCGIAGEISFTGGADVAAVERMAAVLAPRDLTGPGRTPPTAWLSPTGV